MFWAEGRAGSEAGTCLVYEGRSQETSVAAVGCVRGEVVKTRWWQSLADCYRNFSFFSEYSGIVGGS